MKEQENQYSIDQAQISFNAIENKGEIGEEPVGWVYTNDAGLGELAKEMAQLDLPEVNSDEHIRTYFILGSGGLLSMAPHFKDKFDTVIIADNNKFVLNWMDLSTKTLRNTSTPEEYSLRIAEDPQYQNLASSLAENDDSVSNWQNLEKQSLGDRHFLHSQENFEASKKSLQDKPIHFIQGNFLNGDFVKELSTSLKNANMRITQASVTDTADWHEGFTQEFAQFSPAEDALIYWSSKRGGKEGNPKAQYSIGMKEYTEKATQTREQTVYQRVDPIQIRT